MLSHAVMRVVQVFPSFVTLSLVCVFVRVFGLPSVEMWLDHGEDRCCGLSKVGLVETVGFRQVMWLVMLKSAKDRVSGVDPPGQHVPPRVRYGMACWLIRKALVSLSCPEVRDWYSDTYETARCKRGLRVQCATQQGETIAIAKGVWGYSVIPKSGNPMAKQDKRSGVNLCKGM
jgi:hypothetical protein